MKITNYHILYLIIPFILQVLDVVSTWIAIKCLPPIQISPTEIFYIYETNYFMAYLMSISPILWVIENLTIGYFPFIIGYYVRTRFPKMTKLPEVIYFVIDFMMVLIFMEMALVVFNNFLNIQKYYWVLESLNM